MIDKLAVFVLTYHKHSKDHLERCLWSIESQEPSFDVDVIVNYNSTNKDYFDKVANNLSDDYELIQTESDGFTGKGTNSCLDYYLKVCKERDYSHMCIIDGDDYYYPMAFDLLGAIHDKSNFDFLSGMAHHVDSLRPAPPQDGREVIPYLKGRWVWSFTETRLPVFPYQFWNGKQIPGGEVTLCLSTKAVDSNIRALEGANRVDDYFYLLKAITAHLRGDITFVSTDCNDIYIYDCTQEGITRDKEDDFDPERGWPFDKAGLVLSEVTKPEYKVLEGITRQHFPYVTMPQVWYQMDKCEYLRGNEIQ